ncbi:SUN domain-containing protein 3 [Heteronotia binoei]|uniref:SUN domain-containing protein 3 n=1 Tax=Heteronotia binoei TaxID=13085 RepID=UPI00292E700E|nr:SUN domain-containing protein 3 [Heteronotia binoei]
MDRVARTSNDNCSDSETQQCSQNCASSHPLFNQARRNAWLPKRTITRTLLNVIFLSLITPFCLGKVACCIAFRGYSSHKIVFSATLFLMVFGASYNGLIDRCFQQLGEDWKDFSICDCIQGETKDLRSLIKATHILERKARQIPFLKEELHQLQSQLHVLSSDANTLARRAVSKVLQSYVSKGVTTWSIQKMLEKIMRKLDEDEVQMPDYALQSSGAHIVWSRTTRSYRHEGGNYFWGPIKVLPYVKSADVILQPDRSPGNCWPFPGHQGEALVKLATAIVPTAVTIDHISKNISPTAEISSAPKDFAIYGLKKEEEDGTFLGQFVYDAEGPMVQTFQLKGNSSDIITHVKLKVLSNWGKPAYTCVYRFRVHGD